MHRYIHTYVHTRSVGWYRRIFFKSRHTSGRNPQITYRLFICVLHQYTVNTHAKSHNNICGVAYLLRFMSRYMWVLFVPKQLCVYTRRRTSHTKSRPLIHTMYELITTRTYRTRMCTGFQPQNNVVIDRLFTF